VHPDSPLTDNICRPLALPVSITGQRSLQPHHVHPEQHPPPQRPPLTASQYQRSIYRGDTGRLAQAAQQQPGAASVSQATNGMLPAQSSAEQSAPTKPVPVLQEPGTIPETSNGPTDAAQELPVVPAAGASAAVAALSPTENSAPEGSSKPPPGQPGAVPGSSKAEQSQQTHQLSSSSTPAAPAVHPQPLHMPPLPPPTVHHVQMGTAEVNDILKVPFCFNGSLKRCVNEIICPDHPAWPSEIKDVQQKPSQSSVFC